MNAPRSVKSGVLDALLPGRPVSYAEIAAVVYAGRTVPPQYEASIRCTMQRLRECGCSIQAVGEGRFLMDPRHAERRQGTLAQRSRAALARLRANAARAAR